MATTKTQLALIKKDVEYMKKGFDRLEKSLNEVKKNTEANFVMKAEFTPVRQIVYGMVGLVMMAVVGALISLVVSK
jgi:hypothetical protein